MNKAKSRRQFWGNLILLGTLVLLLAGCDLVGMFEHLELAAGDVTLNLRGIQPLNKSIMIVGIDPLSLEKSGYAWPWPRGYIAKIVEAIAMGKPSVVALDILFLEPSSSDEDDQALAVALQKIDHVVLASIYSTDRPRTGVYVSTVELPVQILSDSAEAVGLISISVDTDGRVRGLPKSHTLDGVTYRSLAFQVASIYSLRAPHDNVSMDPALLERGDFAINFRGPANTFSTISAVTVVTGEINPEVFRDKIVLIGAIDKMLNDFYAVPFGGFRDPMAGVEILANAIDTHVKGDYILRIGVGGKVEGLPSSFEELRYGTYFVALRRSHHPWSITFLSIACLMGYTIGYKRRLANSRYLIVVMLGYVALWGIVFIVFRVQIPLVTTEISILISFILASNFRRYASRYNQQ